MHLCFLLPLVFLGGLDVPPVALEGPVSVREIVPGVFAAGFSDRYGSANAGWVVFEDHVTLIGAPHPDLVDGLLAEASRTGGKPVRECVFTHVRRGEADAARVLASRGVALIAGRVAAVALREAIGAPAGLKLREVADRLELKDATRQVEVIALGHAAGRGDAAVHVHGVEALFTGEACVNGPRAALKGSNTALWIRALGELRKLRVRAVVPGFGSAGGPEILERNERYLMELQRQVGHSVARGFPLDEVRRSVRIEPEWLVWMPYDHPVEADIDHVIAELTVPQAPYTIEPFLAGDARPRALAVIGDGPHEPGHLEPGLRRAFDAAGVAVRFAVDPRALSAENLKAVQLLVMLRDGMVWPEGPQKLPRGWMTPDQERAIVDFVERGGGFFAVHNSTGLYPEGGPYLKLLGGTYNGHGPLERFRVRVLDPAHPITRGVTEYEVADEQHTPVPDEGKVHFLLESRSAGGVTASAGWVREPGKGRVAYLANGHTRDALEHPTYQLLMQNAMRWCLRLEK